MVADDAADAAAVCSALGGSMVNVLTQVTVTGTRGGGGNPASGTTANFGNPNARGGSFIPRGPVGGGYSFGGGFAVAAQTPPAYSSPSCGDKFLGFVMSGLGDLGTLAGVGAVVKVGAGAIRSARAARLPLRAFSSGGYTVFGPQSRMVGTRAALLTAPELTGVTYALAEGARDAAIFQGTNTLRGFIPVVATADALREMRSACAPQ